MGSNDNPTIKVQIVGITEYEVICLYSQDPRSFRLPKYGKGADWGPVNWVKQPPEIGSCVTVGVEGWLRALHRPLVGDELFEEFKRERADRRLQHRAKMRAFFKEPVS